MFCKVIESHQIKKNIDKLFADFSALGESGGKLSLYRNNVLQTKSITQSVIYSKHSKEQRLLKSVILRSSIKAEMISPGSSDLCIKFLLDIFDKNITITDDILNTINKESIRPDSKLIKKYIKEYFDEKEVSSLLIELLDII